MFPELLASRNEARFPTLSAAGAHGTALAFSARDRFLSPDFSRPLRRDFVSAGLSAAGWSGLSRVGRNATPLLVLRSLGATRFHREDEGEIRWRPGAVESRVERRLPVVGRHHTTMAQPQPAWPSAARYGSGP